jgi:hypothetical protein
MDELASLEESARKMALERYHQDDKIAHAPTSRNQLDPRQYPVPDCGEGSGYQPYTLEGVALNVEQRLNHAKPMSRRRAVIKSRPQPT